jgi:hypothetical protein
MTHHAAARAAAIHCEAKKHAYRQTQDGVVVSFVLHPQDVPDGLATSGLGTRYMLALVEINDDETPKEPQNVVQLQPPKEQQSQSWHNLKPAQQAGILCNERSFLRFLSERKGTPIAVRTPEQAAIFVRGHCIVQSRSDIRDNHPSGRLWRDLVSDYRAWMRELEVVG